MNAPAVNERRPAELAEAAAEAIRALNHATIRGGGYQWPADVDTTLGALHELAIRLPQAVDQASRWLARAHAAGTVGHDQGGDVAAAINRAVLALDDAAGDAAELAHSLAVARRDTARLTGGAA